MNSNRYCHSRDAYSRYERNDVKPTIEIATKIANALNISLDYLVGKTNLELDSSMLKSAEAVIRMIKKDKMSTLIKKH